MLIDTHCHLYSEELLPDIESIIKNTTDKKISYIIMPNIDLDSIHPMLELEKKYPQCISTIGIHPCYVSSNPEKELEVVKYWLGKRKFAAIGECGLDLYWDKTTFEQQKKALWEQFILAEKYDLPLLLHTREATEQTIELIKEYNNGQKKLKGIFHCFSGNLKEAEKIIELGFFLGIGGVLTFKNSGLDKVVEQIDIKYLVLETDSPYLAPVPFRGKRNEPSYTYLVAQKLAEIKNIDIETIAQITTENAKKIFNIR